MFKAEDVDYETLAMAMQDDRSMGTEYYLSLDTGQVLITSPGWEDYEEDSERVENGNYAWIEPMDSRDSYRHMEEFVELLPGGETRSVLGQALALPKPFRRFKDALEAFPEERQAWLDFKEEAMKRHALSWLEDLGPAGQDGPITGE